MIRAAMVLATVALLFAPAHASRSCLDKDEAARTWPGRALAIDDDGCWTYFRRGFKPAPVDDNRPANAQPTVPPNVRKWSNTMAEMPEIDPEVQAIRWADRWPDVIVVPLKRESFEPPQPSMRAIFLGIAIIALCCFLFAVAFGGAIERRNRETRDGYFT